MDWKKSSACKADSPMCAEVGTDDHLPGRRFVRNSQHPHQWVTFTDEEWEAFTAGVKAGEF